MFPYPYRPTGDDVVGLVTIFLHVIVLVRSSSVRVRDAICVHYEGQASCILQQLRRFAWEKVLW